MKCTIASGGSERKSGCFKCGEQGHKKATCLKGVSGGRVQKPGHSNGGGGRGGYNQGHGGYQQGYSGFNRRFTHDKGQLHDFFLVKTILNGKTREINFTYFLLNFQFSASKVLIFYGKFREINFKQFIFNFLQIFEGFFSMKSIIVVPKS